MLLFGLGFISCLLMLLIVGAVRVRAKRVRKVLHLQNSVENVRETVLAVLQNNKEEKRYVN